MLKRVVLAGFIAVLGGAAQAEQAQRWVTQDGNVLPAVNA